MSNRRHSNRINWHGNQPIIQHVRDVLPRVFPVLATPGHGQHASGVGGYNNRTTRFGTFSAHSEGRAADIFLDASIPVENAIADGLFFMFINNANQLGVDNVIWNRQIWSVTNGGPITYGHSPHRDHVHVEFTRAGSQLRPASLQSHADRVRMSVVQMIRSQVATGE